VTQTIDQEALESLRFPVGKFSRPASSMAGIRRAHINTLKLLPERLRAAVSGLDDHRLDTPYREGGWTVRQVVHHIADSHANAYVRMKLALTEDWPTIKPYDEAAWAELSDARWLPVEISLDLITALHPAGSRSWNRSPTMIFNAATSIRRAAGKISLKCLRTMTGTAAITLLTSPAFASGWVGNFGYAALRRRTIA